VDGALRADLLRVADPGSPYEDTGWNTRAIVLGVLDALGAWAVIAYRFRRRVRTSSMPARGIEKGASPRFGDFVYLAPGAKVFGPVRMGDRSAAGANAAVTRDVAPGVTVGGVPAVPIGTR
jgi:acetyltransferase-like isoleucine patch superfamily enzyme